MRLRQQVQRMKEASMILPIGTILTTPDGDRLEVVDRQADDTGPCFYRLEPVPAPKAVPGRLYRSRHARQSLFVGTDAGQLLQVSSGAFLPLLRGEFEEVENP